MDTNPHKHTIKSPFLGLSLQIIFFYFCNTILPQFSNSKIYLKVRNSELRMIFLVIFSSMLKAHLKIPFILLKLCWFSPKVNKNLRSFFYSRPILYSSEPNGDSSSPLLVIKSKGKVSIYFYHVKCISLPIVFCTTGHFDLKSHFHSDHSSLPFSCRNSEE